MLTEKREKHPVTLKGLSKYEVHELKGETLDEKWANLKASFEREYPVNKNPEDITYRANEMNLLIGSTSGIHGSYTTLDDLENPESERHKDSREEGLSYKEVIEYDEAFTFLIIQPRICRLIYGTIGFRSKEDFTWMRTIISESVAEIIKSQQENIL